MITRRELAVFSQRFLKILERESISASEDLVNRIGLKSSYSEDSPETLEISSTPSERGTTATDLSYFSREGIALASKINPSLNYTVLIFKCGEEVNLEGFSAFGRESFGNDLYFGRIRGNELEVTIRHFEILSRLG